MSVSVFEEEFGIILREHRNSKDTIDALFRINKKLVDEVEELRQEVERLKKLVPEDIK